MEGGTGHAVAKVTGTLGSYWLTGQVIYSLYKPPGH